MTGMPSSLALAALEPALSPARTRLVLFDTDPVAFLRSDPSQYADENPCVPQANNSLPSWDDVADYADGVVNPILIRNDDVYVYRGVNEEAALSREHGYPTHIGTSPRYHSQ